MDYSALSSRAIRGWYFARLEVNPGLAWVGAVSNYYPSDQGSETYEWLGMPPVLREWIGGRNAKGMRTNGLTIANKHYEATLEIAIKDLRRDKTGQIMARVQDFADRQMSHWASLVSTLRANGAATLCYDGQYFYDTDHAEGKSGTQSNSIQVDISTLPALVHGASATAPSVEEFQQSILQGIIQIIGFKDDQGEPMNEDASAFLVQVPTALAAVGKAAVSRLSTAMLQNNMDPNLLGDFTVTLSVNPRLTWTDSFTVDRTDSAIKPFIRQYETEEQMRMKDENSEYAFDNDAIQMGIDVWRNVGYGLWQRSCKVQMI